VCGVVQVPPRALLAVFDEPPVLGRSSCEATIIENEHDIFIDDSKADARGNIVAIDGSMVAKTCTCAFHNCIKLADRCIKMPIL
jgi:hypothetical protein